MQVTDSRGDSNRLLKHGGATTHAGRDARDAQPLRSLGQPTEGHDMIHMLKWHTSDWYRTNALSDVDRCASSFSLTCPISYLLTLLYYSWFHVRVWMTAGLGFFTDA